MIASALIGWKPAPLKRFLSKNDSGVWGDEPTGVNDCLVLRSTDIGLDGSWEIEDPAWRSLEFKESQQALLYEGDLVVVKSSGSVAHLGKTALVTTAVARRKARFANFVQRLRPANTAYPRYLWYLLNSSFARRQLELLGTTTTGLRNLNAEIIGSIECPGPPLERQRAIADFLDAETARIDALIDKKHRLATKLHERRAAIMLSGVAGELLRNRKVVDSSLSWIEHRPEHWEEPLLKLVAQLGSGHTPSRNRPEWWVDCTIHRSPPERSRKCERIASSTSPRHARRSASLAWRTVQPSCIQRGP